MKRTGKRLGDHSRAFRAEALEEVADDTLAEHMLDRLEGWLARRR